MDNQKKPTAAISAEQLDALAQSILPVMREFFGSEREMKIGEEHLKKTQQSNGKVADRVIKKFAKIFNSTL